MLALRVLADLRAARRGRVLADQGARPVHRPGPERARALVNRGFLRSFQGEIESALADCEAGTAMALTIGDDGTTARGYQHASSRSPSSAGMTRRLKVADEARARLRACGDRIGELILMGQLGHLHQLAGQARESVAVCEEGLAMLGPDSREQWIQTYLYFISGIALFQMPGREVDCEAAAQEGAGRQAGTRRRRRDGVRARRAWVAGPVKTGSPARAAWLHGRGGSAVGTWQQRAVQRHRDHGGVSSAGGAPARPPWVRLVTRRSTRRVSATCGSGSTPARAAGRCGWRSLNGSAPWSVCVGGQGQPDTFGMIALGFQGA